MRKLNGIMLHNNELHIGWGKAIPLPAIPIYDPREGAVVSAIPAAATRPVHLLPDLIVPKKAYNDDVNVHRVSIGALSNSPHVQQLIITTTCLAPRGSS